MPVKLGINTETGKITQFNEDKILNGKDDNWAHFLNSQVFHISGPSRICVNKNQDKILTLSDQSVNWTGSTNEFRVQSRSSNFEVTDEKTLFSIYKLFPSFVNVYDSIYHSNPQFDPKSSTQITGNSYDLLAAEPMDTANITDFILQGVYNCRRVFSYNGGLVVTHCRIGNIMRVKDMKILWNVPDTVFADKCGFDVYCCPHRQNRT